MHQIQTSPLTYWAFANEFVGEFVSVGLLRASILEVTEDRPHRPVNSVVICQENGYPYNTLPTRIGSFEQDEITSNQLLPSENLQVFPNLASAVLHIASQGIELIERLSPYQATFSNSLSKVSLCRAA